MHEARRTILVAIAHTLALTGLFHGQACAKGAEQNANEQRASPTAKPSYAIRPVLPALAFEKPVAITTGDGGSAIYVVEQKGRIQRVDNQVASSKTLFLDLNTKGERVRCCDEEGLLSVAFAPGFETHRRLFVYYTAASNPRRSIVARLTAGKNLSQPVEIGTEQILMEIPQPYSNHNGGQLAFGPDGKLYIGLGDGGSANDPGNRGQNLEELLGKILRIEVSTGDKATYRVPADNPFVKHDDARKEIWAWGLRNPWRFSFDRAAPHTLWTADVGQNQWEEVDIIVRGKNYGWKVMEGEYCTGSRTDRSCASPSFEPPVATYGRRDGCSVTGGYVYRGKKAKGLVGAYIYGDYCSGHIWAVRNGQPAEKIIPSSGARISTFGETADGEIWVADYLTGRLYEIVQTAAGSANAR